MKAPVNMRIDEWPYPHLRDDDGAILCRDYQDREKLEFIFAAVEAAIRNDVFAAGWTTKAK